MKEQKPAEHTATDDGGSQQGPRAHSGVWGTGVWAQEGRRPLLTLEHRLLGSSSSVGDKVRGVGCFLLREVFTQDDEMCLLPQGETWCLQAWWQQLGTNSVPLQKDMAPPREEIINESLLFVATSWVGDTRG